MQTKDILKQLPGKFKVILPFFGSFSTLIYFKSVCFLCLLHFLEGVTDFASVCN